MPNSLVNLPNLLLERSDRVSTIKKRGGGSCLYIAKVLAYKCLPEVNLGEANSTWIKIKLAN